MKKSLFVIFSLVLTAVFFLWPGNEKDQSLEVYADTESHLLLPQKNVVIAVVDLEDLQRSLLESETLSQLADLHNSFMKLQGVAKVDSLISAPIVASEYDDIIVRRIIPQDRSLWTNERLQEISDEIPLYPELMPYINEGQDKLLFYIYYGYRAQPSEIFQEIQALQDEADAILPFEFTGRSPIIAQTEKLLTKDIVIFFPVLLIMVIFVFSFFKNIKAIFQSLFLLVISMAMAYGFIHFLNIPDSPLILLIPVFGLGLLSDYIIHYFYHRLYSPLKTSGQSVRRQLIFPLSLTALSTLTGFLSLIFINGSGHLQLGTIIAAAVVVTWVGVFLWFNYGNYESHKKRLLSGFQDFQVKLFNSITKYRIVLFIILGLAMVWGILQLPKLRIEPYPIEQLPENSTIKIADESINTDFYGTLPFFLEIDTGVENGILTKETMTQLSYMHDRLEENPEVGYGYSVLTVMKRMNYFFQGEEDSFLTSDYFDDFYDALIMQYLLYYSSSADPLEYESLVDSSFRYVSIKGLLYYENSDSLDNFMSLVEEIETELPEGWTIGVHGMAEQLLQEKNNLRNNWMISFLIGSFLIFITVLIFYRKIALALLSLLPGLISMVISFGIISISGIRIDAFSIIFVAIITGLVIDYSIHTLVALDRMKATTSLKEGFLQIMGYSGIPIFLSFMTSLLSFSVLFISSFRGARNLGLLLVTSLVLSFFFSLYLLPLIILPFKIKKEKEHEQ